MTEQMSGWWGVWCEPTDGRRYWLGDSSRTRWTQETAEGVAAHLAKHETGTFTALPMPLAAKEPGIVALLRTEAHEHINAIEVMLQSKHHTELRDDWSRWSQIASLASQAANALEMAERYEHEEHEH